MGKHLLIAFILLTQFLQAQKKELPVKIIEATSQNWVSGAPGGRTGVNYSIKLSVHTDKKIAFTNLWLGKENVPFEKEFYSEKTRKKIQPGDSLLITYNKINGEKNENADAKRVPIDYSGAALIEYTIGGCARYSVVKTVKQVAPLQGK